METVLMDMVGGAAKFMLDRFILQLKQQKALIGDTPDQVDQLENDLNILQKYLNDSIKMPKSDDTIDLLREVHDSIYDAEDAMDSFMEAAVRGRDSIHCSRVIPKSKLVRSAELVKSACERVKSVRQRFKEVIDQIGNTSTTQDDELENQVPPTPSGRNYAKFFEDEENRLRERLTKEARQPEVIFITGSNGVGKTTLAAKLFHDSNIPFTKRIWVSVSNPTATNIFLTVLRQLKKLSDENMSRNADDLSLLVESCLERETLLIVVDNISETDDLKKLWSAFNSRKSRSKVLIICNDEQMARLVGPQNPFIQLNKLDRNESWSLLEWLRFKDMGCPPELEGDGRLIAAQCGGLTQNIVFAADVLAENDSSSDEMRQRQQTWQAVCRDLSAYFNDSTRPRSTGSIRSCCNDLPHHLRPCFLYLGIFPKHSKFSASKLIGMWIAEGFIPSTDDDLSLEETAENYLKELISRKIISVEVQSSGDAAKSKTCRISRLFYNFCKTEAGTRAENFLQEYRENTKESVFIPPITQVEKNRRVCIHAHISNFIPKLISSIQYPRSRIRLRSFVSHDDEAFTLDRRDVPVIRLFFQLLRVLDAKPFEFNKIPSDLCRLVHLRYVTLSLKGGVLPASISNLRKMQTLIVHTGSPVLKIKADVLRMSELRHLETNASATLPRKSKGSDARVRTICGISPKSLTNDFVDKARKLMKLGIRGQLALLLGDTELLRKLDTVEKLKLLTDKATALSSQGNLSNLLQPVRFPASMRSLTLSATQLEWKHVSTLGKLETLEKLKLKDNAFVGGSWDVSEDFPHLQSLHIEGLNFVEWKFTKGINHFPELRRLELSDCEKLTQVPIELASSTTFRELYMHNGNTIAIASAYKIYYARFDLIIKQPSSEYTSIDLIITPEPMMTH